jgi:hypothetical protein
MEAIKNHSAENFKISGDWNVQSKNLKDKFSSLTDADLKFEIGKENELLTRIESKLNMKRDEVINIIKKGMSDKL